MSDSAQRSCSALTIAARDEEFGIPTNALWAVIPLTNARLSA